MNVEVTINYTTGDVGGVNDSIATLLETVLPYMVDNVAISFDVVEA